MLFHFMAALRARAAEAGQGKAEYVLILAPLSVMLALTVWTLIMSATKPRRRAAVRLRSSLTALRLRSNLNVRGVAQLG